MTVITRYRYTAALVMLLIHEGYKSPHHTINAYLRAFTKFRPNDGDDLLVHELKLPSTFDVKRIVGDRPSFGIMCKCFLFLYLNIFKCFSAIASQQLDMLSNAIFTQFVYGSYSLSFIDSSYRASFVQYGYARHKHGTSVEVIDEPLVIFAALTWFQQHKHFSLLNCLRRDIHMHSTRRNGFEAYLTFYIRQIFEIPQTLDAVFSFRSDFAKRTDLSWQRKKFELVTVSRSQGGQTKVSLVTTQSGPSSSIGFIAGSGQEVLDWIETNEDEYTFCFPPPSCGPDVLYYLRCQCCRRLLLVAKQCKKHAEVSHATLIEGLRSVSPQWFWRSKDLTVHHSWHFETNRFFT